jgi:hypothetical protein
MSSSAIRDVILSAAKDLQFLPAFTNPLLKEHNSSRAILKKMSS